MHKRLVERSLALLCCLFLSMSADAKQSIFSAEQIFAFTRIARVEASPDGKKVAYITFSRKKERQYQQWQYALYVRGQNGITTLITQANTMAGLTWSPDSSEVAILTQGKQYQSIVVFDIANPDHNKLIELQFDIESFKWSPNQKYIAMAAAESPKRQANALSLININDHYRKNKLYLLNYSENRSKPKAITPDKYSVSQFFSWAPDSQSIAFAYQPRSGSTYVNESKIAIVNVTSKKILTLPYTENYIGVQPYYSHNGEQIAFQSNLEGKTRARTILNDVELNDRVCVFNIKSQQTSCLANTFNENPAIMGWDATDSKIFVFEEYKTKGYEIYALSLDPKQPPENFSNDLDGFIEPLTITLNQSGTIFGFGYETANKAPDVFIKTISPSALEQVSQLQSQQPRFDLGQIQTIRWQSTDKTEIEGLLITPKDYDAKKKYPLLVTVHGGPAGAWAKRYLGGCDEYELMIDPTSCWGNLTSMGFVILAPNVRGSTGYGKTFRAANYADFGGGDYRDLMSGVDYLIQQGIADKDHLAITGWSFGGYMTAWVIGQTNQFKAAVDGAGNTDFISFSGTSDIPYYYVKYLGTTFWDDDRLYLQRAPIMHVKNIKTPLLILHGENDLRVPISQAYELYTALRQQNKETKFMVLPLQSHVPTDPNIIADSIDQVNDWLKKAL